MAQRACEVASVSQFGPSLVQWSAGLSASSECASSCPRIEVIMVMDGENSLLWWSRHRGHFLARVACCCVVQIGQRGRRQVLGVQGSGETYQVMREGIQ